MIRKILLFTSACRSAALIRVYDPETGRYEWDLNCKYEFHPETF